MSTAQRGGTATDREHRGQGQPVRATPQRRAVTSSLAELDGFHSAQDLHRLITESGKKVSLATVYRILQSLEEAGEVDVLPGEDGQALYRQCAAEEHHHHLRCRSCGRAEDIGADVVEAWAEQIAGRYGYTDIRHVVEVSGICERCAAAQRD